MPHNNYLEWDRILILKLICTMQMTISAILFLLYGYLIALQNWSSHPEKRSNVLFCKWIIVSVTVLDFSCGALLAQAANVSKNYRRPLLLLWILAEVFLLPVTVYYHRVLEHNITHSNELSTDIHFLRINFVHLVYSMIHVFFIMGVINFLAYHNPRVKIYDPSLRPDSVFEPTDPKITTTESRHIRFSESFLQNSTRSSLDFGAGTSNNTYLRRQNPIQYRNCFGKQGLSRLQLLPLLTLYILGRASRFVYPSSRNRSPNKRRDNYFQLQPQHLELQLWFQRLHLFLVEIRSSCDGKEPPRQEF